MNAVVDKKLAAVTAKDTKPTGAAGNQTETKPAADDTSAEKTPAENLRDSLEKLDAERAAMAKDAIENLKPGRAFDASVVREINKVETRKNRLLVSLFASLLRKGGPEIQTIVHQLVEL